MSGQEGADAKAGAALDEGAEALAPRVERVAPGVYAVPSRSAPGELHVVVDRQVAKISGAATLGRYGCDCKAHAFDSACSHIGAVVERRRQERQRALEARKQRAQPGAGA